LSFEHHGGAADPATFSAPAFLILCRLFDGCYDDLKQQEHMTELVESTAEALLAGVEALEEQSAKVQDVTIGLTFAQRFFLRKLVQELLSRLPQDEEQERNRRWLEEALGSLGGSIE